MNIRKQIKLDLISIKPYLTIKNLFIFLGIAIFYMFINNSPNSIISMSMFIAMLYSSYPFLLGENSGIDGLYRLLSIDSRDVVIGRYILALIFYFVSSIVGFIFSLIFATIKEYSIDLDILFSFGINFLAFAIIVCLQYPIYFKYGYTKAKTWIVLPVFIIGIIAMLAGFFIKDFDQAINFVYQNKELIIIFSIILLILIIAISFKLAIKFCKKRDF